MAGANPGIHCFRGRPPKSCAALTGLRRAALFICFAALMQGAAFAVCTHPHRGDLYQLAGPCVEASGYTRREITPMRSHREDRKYKARVNGLEVGGVGYFDFKCISMARLSISKPFLNMVRSS